MIIYESVHSKYPTMSSLLEKIEAFDIDALKPMLPEVDDINLSKDLRHLFSSPKIIEKQRSGAQKRRDKFLQELVAQLKSLGYDESVMLIEQKSEIIANAETLFKGIRGSLTTSPSAKFSDAAQVWSHIQRAETEAKMVAEDMTLKQASMAVDTPYIVSGSTYVINKDGQRYNPDAALEEVVRSLSLTLSMLSYELGLNEPGGRTCLPPRPKINEEHIFAAGITQALAISWKRLEEASFRALVFGGNTECSAVEADGTNIITYKIDRQFSEFEWIELLAHERHNYKLAQNFSEMALGLKHLKFPLLSEVGPVAQGRMLSLEEAAAVGALDEAFCFDIGKHLKQYGGLRLREWIRGYAILRYIAEKYIPAGGGTIYSEDDLLAELVDGGLPRASAQVFVQNVTFGKGSRDLFDTPLIKLEAGGFYFFAPAMTSAQIVNVFLSRMSSLEIQVDKKGHALEAKLTKLLTKAGLTNHSFKFREEDEEYEYDNVLIFGKRAFVIECKNRGLWMNNAVACYRKFEELSATVDQVKRLSSALLRYPQHFKRHFKIDLSEFEIVPVILNGMPIAYPDLYEDVYVTDLSAIGRFLKSKEISMEALGTDQKIPAHQLWAGDSPTDDDLMQQLKNPVQLARFNGYVKNREATYLIGKHALFTTNHLEVKHSELNEAYIQEFLKATKDGRLRSPVA